MYSLKEQLNKLSKYFQENLAPITGDKCEFMDLQRNIFYFSKFSFVLQDFIKIFKFIRTIKENTFKKLIELNKETVRLYLDFPCATLEKDKVIILFSLFYLHYYSYFGYDIHITFEQFFNQDLIFLSSKFQIIIKDEMQFKNISFGFFTTFQSEIKNNSYEKIQYLKLFYNPSLIHNYNVFYQNNLFNWKSDQNTNLQLINNSPQKHLLTKLLVAKERIVNMVLAIKEKKNGENFHQEAWSVIQKMSEISKEVYLKEMTEYDKKEHKSIFSIETNDNSSFNQISTSIDSNYSFYSNGSSIDNNYSFYSKRLLSELTKCEVSPQIQNLIDEISNKIEENYLDSLINNQYNCSINQIHPFLCYICEITPDFIRNIPEYKDIKYDLTLKFIVPAINIYYSILEIYFSLCDLTYTNKDTFIYILNRQNFPEKYSKSVYHFCKKISESMKENPDDIKYKMENILENVFNKISIEWDNTFIDKVQELDHFYLI